MLEIDPPYYFVRKVFCASDDYLGTQFGSPDSPTTSSRKKEVLVKCALKLTKLGCSL